MSLMRKMMFSVHGSQLDFDETVSALREAAEHHGWDVPMTHDLQGCYHEAGLEDMTRVTTLYLCYPDGGYRILQDDANKPLAVMMPMGVSVYETSEGEVFIAGMNLGRMSTMFSGTAKEVLREGAARYEAALADVAELEPSDEIEVDGRRCCLGCVSLAAVGAALVGGLLFVAAKLIPKIMPKMMAKMMPRMMEMMEEANVEPPCAQIISERLEARRTSGDVD